MFYTLILNEILDNKYLYGCESKHMSYNNELRFIICIAKSNIATWELIDGSM